MQNIWKIINEYPRYSVSNEGEIKRIGGKYSQDKILKPMLHKYGYYRICLYNKGIKRSILLHRLIAKEFINNPENKPTVNHINGIKTDNNVNNLEWATVSEQNKHYFRVLGGKPNKTALGKFGILNSAHKKILCINTNKVFYGIKEASREMHLQQACISRVANGISKHTSGYNFKFIL